MKPSKDANHEDWQDRFRAVARAQGRYLWLLLFAGVFYIGLDSAVSEQAEPSRQQVPMIGIELSSRVIWASGPLVLGFIALATLGTFPALTHAYSKANPPEGRRRSFESLDTEPNVIDFAVYTLPEAPKWTRLALGTYPLFITIIIGEAVWLWCKLAQRTHSSPSDWVFLILGAFVTFASVYRLIGLWKKKIGAIARGD